MDSTPRHILLPFYCLGSVTWYKKLLEAGAVYFDLQEPFPRQTCRNRYYIVAANGVSKLIIPLKHPQSKVPFRDIQVSRTEDWQRHHWKTIRSAYGRSPFFEYYADYFAPMYENTSSPWLHDFNRNMLDTTFRLLHIKQPVHYLEATTSILPENDLRPWFEFPWQKYPLTPQTDRHRTLRPYPQVFDARHGFIPDMSILDALFCLGPQALQAVALPREA